jgi:hypothetical protein
VGHRLRRRLERHRHRTGCSRWVWSSERPHTWRCAGRSARRLRARRAGQATRLAGLVDVPGRASIASAGSWWARRCPPPTEALATLRRALVLGLAAGTLAAGMVALALARHVLAPRTSHRLGGARDSRATSPGASVHRPPATSSKRSPAAARRAHPKGSRAVQASGTDTPGRRARRRLPRAAASRSRPLNRAMRIRMGRTLSTSVRRRATRPPASCPGAASSRVSPREEEEGRAPADHPRALGALSHDVIAQWLP